MHRRVGEVALIVIALALTLSGLFHDSWFSVASDSGDGRAEIGPRALRRGQQLEVQADTPAVVRGHDALQIGLQALVQPVVGVGRTCERNLPSVDEKPLHRRQICHSHSTSSRSTT